MLRLTNGCCHALKPSYITMGQGLHQLDFTPAFQTSCFLLWSISHFGKLGPCNRGGTKPISVRKLSAENLTKAIVESQTHTILKQAQTFSQELKPEDSLANSTRLIEKYSY
jgi:hypothetical protein